MNRVRVVAVITAAVMALSLGAASTASAAVLDDYCSPTGDYCTSVQEGKSNLKFKLVSLAFDGKFTLCLKGPDGKDCSDFRLAQRGDHWEFTVTYKANEPGNYAVTWFYQGSKLGRTLKFVVNGRRSPLIAGFAGCGKVNDEGGRSPVKAAVISCEKGRPIAKDFIKKDVVKKGWTTYNPAGCEFFMYRKADQAMFDAWVDAGGVPTFKLLYFIKTRGCES